MCSSALSWSGEDYSYSKENSLLLILRINWFQHTYFFPIFDVHINNFWWYGSPMSNGQILDLLDQSVVKEPIFEWKWKSIHKGAWRINKQSQFLTKFNKNATRFPTNFGAGWEGPLPGSWDKETVKILRVELKFTHETNNPYPVLIKYCNKIMSL